MKPSSARTVRPMLLLLVLCACSQSVHQTAVHHRRVTRVSPSVTQSAAPAAAPTQALASATPAPIAGGPRLAIIIDDCGQWLTTEREFIALPVPLTLSVLPDVRYGHLVSQEAAAAGKGIMLHLPMETISGLNPGPGKITTEMTDTQIGEQVAADLADVPLAAGVNNHEGSKATQDPRVMRDVAKALVRHGNLFFVDSLTIGDSVAAQEARAAGLPAATRDVFLDNRADIAYTEGQLLEAARLAKRQGSAIAIGHPRPTTLTALRAMIPGIERSGVQFVLVSQLVGPGAQPTP